MKVYDENKKVVDVPDNLTESQKSGVDYFRSKGKRYFLKDGGCVSYNEHTRILKAEEGTTAKYIYESKHLDPEFISPAAPVFEVPELPTTTAQSTESGYQPVPTTGWWDEIPKFTSSQEVMQKMTRTALGVDPESLVSNPNKFTNWKDFRDYMYAALKKKGVSDEAAKLMTAQMGQESGHGKFVVGNYNYSNITAGSSWKGATKQKGSNPRHFRHYGSAEEALSDYLNFNRSLYDVQLNDSAQALMDKWLGHNSGNRAWNGKDNQEYKNRILQVYKMYWG